MLRACIRRLDASRVVVGLERVELPRPPAAAVRSLGVVEMSIAAVAGCLPAAIGANARNEGLICPAACGAEAAWASPDMLIQTSPAVTHKLLICIIFLHMKRC